MSDPDESSGVEWRCAAGKEYREDLLSVLEVGEAGHMLEGVGDNTMKEARVE